jgi:hypothetical protein
VIAGYSRTEFGVKGRLSWGKRGNCYLGVYGGGQWGALGLRTGASSTWHEIESLSPKACSRASEFRGATSSDPRRRGRKGLFLGVASIGTILMPTLDPNLILPLVASLAVPYGRKTAQRTSRVRWPWPSSQNLDDRAQE